MSPLQVESETIERGDYDNPVPFRKHARLWLERDFEKAQREKPQNIIEAQGSIQADIAAKYSSEVSPINTEAVEEIDNTVKTPANGMLVHSEYTMYGHFQLLKELFTNTEKVRFYLDQEAGIKNAFMGAFKDRVNDQTADAFYVRVNKGFTVDVKEQLIQECQRRIYALTGVSYRSLSHQEREQAVTALIIAEMDNLRRFNGSKESWLTYLYATKAEPEKMLAALTDISDLSHLNIKQDYIRKAVFTASIGFSCKLGVESMCLSVLSKVVPMLDVFGMATAHMTRPCISSKLSYLDCSITT